MIFILIDIDGREYEVQNAVSFEMIFESDAACAGLRLYFDTDSALPEINTVLAKRNDGTLIFNGFCDVQKESRAVTGFEYFIYARSSASLLVDNEAEPAEYKNPTAKQLFINNARDFGFECALPDIYIENSYIVSKGTSCFGAVNDFVFMAEGTPVYVDENNVLRAYRESSEVKYLDDYDVVSERFDISRCSVISRVDYKINAGEAYKYHCKNTFADENKIYRSRKINLSGLPLWQREGAAQKKITQSLDEYYSLKVNLAGCCDFRLYDRVMSDKGEFSVREIIFSKNEKGEHTALVMKKRAQGRTFNYVAE